MIGNKFRWTESVAEYYEKSLTMYVVLNDDQVGRKLRKGKCIEGSVELGLLARTTLLHFFRDVHLIIPGEDHNCFADFLNLKRSELPPRDHELLEAMDTAAMRLRQ